MTRLDRLTEKLQLNRFKLTSLLEMTKAINDNATVEELLSVYETIIREQLGISKLMLFNEQNNWDCLLSFGIQGEINLNPLELFSQYDGISVLESNSLLEQAGFDVLIPVYHQSQPLAFLIIGDIDEDEIKISPTIKHMNFIQTITNILAVAIENKRLAKENIIKERMNKELELAAEMQAMLVPEQFEVPHGMEVAAHYQPHQQVGGDYYDVIPLNNNEVIFCMADVSGKGVSAAFLMANFQANLHALVQYTDYSLSDMVEVLNNRVNQSTRGERFITLFIARVNFKQQSLRYINAGHNPPILMRNSDLFLLEKGCIGLGMLEDIPRVEEGNIRLKKTNTLLLYTDGLTELENPNKEAFGLERLGETMLQNRNVSMSELNDSIVEAMEQFRKSAPYFDDTALLSCRFSFS